jgi:GGDEF domain-containing protein
MALITEMQITAARYANPLTSLPGAVPLNEHVDRLIELRLPFAACYFDINNFKPFNDHYGYRAGDHVIQMLSGVLRDTVEPKRDFISHIGGDDFMIVFQSEDWELRCASALRRFDHRLVHFIPFDDLSRGGIVGTDRKGQVVFSALPSLAIGALRVEPGDVASHHEVATATAAAKKVAKRAPRSALFVERRRVAAPAQEAAGG